MALYNRGVLPASASIMSPAYRTAAFQHYQADLEPARRQAMQELTDEYNDRGLAGSGLAMRAQAQQRAGVLQSLMQRRQQLGVQQAQAGEQNREALEQRGWRQSDINAANTLEDTLRGWNQEDYNAARQAEPMKRLFGGLGKIGGMAASDYLTQKANQQLSPEELQGVANYAGPPPSSTYY